MNLNKLFSVFVLFVLFISVATFTVAESGSGSSGSDDGSDDSSSSDSNDSSDDSDDDSTNSSNDSDYDDSLEDESEDETDDPGMDSESDLDDSDEVEDESDDSLDDSSDDLDDDSVVDPRLRAVPTLYAADDDYSSGPSNPCEKVLYVEKKLFKLNSELVEESDEGDLEKVQRIKSEIESQRRNLVRAKETCSQASPVRAAVGKVCEVPEDLKNSLEKIKLEYKEAVESKNFEKAKLLREQGAKIDMQIKESRLKCASEIVPGLQRMEDKCEIPAEVSDKLERAQARLAELEKSGASIPEDLREDIADLEDKIAERKAKCNALRVDSKTDSNKIREYYAQRMSEALENNDDDSKIRELRELRKEIDETIKNLVESRKQLRYEEVEGLVNEVKFKAKSTSIGDSETEEEVEIEVEVEDSKVKIKSGADRVILSELGFNFTAENITVNESGIFVGDVLVKNLPSAVFENNKNFERNAKRIYEMRIEEDGKKAVYKAKYESRRKLFGVIGVNAKNEATLDAETGETLSEDKPWWSALSTEVESEDSSDDNSDDTTAVEEAVSTVNDDSEEPTLT